MAIQLSNSFEIKLECQSEDEEYFKDVSNYIYTNIMGFVNDKSLPLCEYLKPISLQRFMDSNIF